MSVIIENIPLDDKTGQTGESSGNGSGESSDAQTARDSQRDLQDKLQGQADRSKGAEGTPGPR